MVRSSLAKYTGCFFLKECAAEIPPSLTGLINLSLRLGQVPTGWKCADAVPIFKKGDNENRNMGKFGNYLSNYFDMPIEYFESIIIPTERYYVLN